jgi:hypothetical protein
MERIDSLEHIAIEVEKLIRSYGRRKDISVTFSCLTNEIIEEFSTWDRKRFGLVSGEEYFFVWENSRPDVADPYGLLYVVCVTADSLLTAASELMNLVSRKF